MAAYATGVSSSPTDLLQTLVTWLVAQGFTSDYSASEGTGWRAHLHKNGLYIHLRAAENEQIWTRLPSGYHDVGPGYGIGLYLGDGYSGAAAWDAQSGAPLRTDGTTVGCGMNLPSGAVAAYHFFELDDHITVVVERASGVYAHLGWGPTLEVDPITGGGLPEDFPYFYGSSSAYRNVYAGALAEDQAGINVTAYPPMSHGEMDPPSGSLFPPQEFVHATGFIRVDAATYSGRWASNGNKDHDQYGYTGRFMRCALNKNSASAGLCNEGEYSGYRFLLARSFQTAFANAQLWPLACYCKTEPAGRWAPVGHPPTIWWCEGVGNGYALGDVKAIGGDDWMLFPGFAVRKAA